MQHKCGVCICECVYARDSRRDKTSVCGLRCGYMCDVWCEGECERVCMYMCVYVCVCVV